MQITMNISCLVFPGSASLASNFVTAAHQFQSGELIQTRLNRAVAILGVVTSWLRISANRYSRQTYRQIRHTVFAFDFRAYDITHRACRRHRALNLWRFSVARRHFPTDSIPKFYYDCECLSKILITIFCLP